MGASVGRKRQEPVVHTRVRYVADPENARAAQEILAEGIRRALAKAVPDRRQEDS